MMVPACPGDLVPLPDGAISCPAGWVAGAYVAPFDPSTIDLAVLGQSFGAGFFLSVTVFSIVWAAAQVVRAIRVL